MHGSCVVCGVITLLVTGMPGCDLQQGHSLRSKVLIAALRHWLRWSSVNTVMCSRGCLLPSLGKRLCPL